MRRIVNITLNSLFVISLSLALTACWGSDAPSIDAGISQIRVRAESRQSAAEQTDTQNTQGTQGIQEPESATLLYQGQGSIRIVTGEGKVIYIDPYAGDQYSLPADLILVTHQHFDHNQIEKIENRAGDCRIITQDEALQNGEYQIFDLGYVTVEAVEAGYNELHDVADGVGYILMLSDGKSVYMSGDTSTTPQMQLLAEKELDYAFFCCDGIYNMSLEEAAACAEMVGAKYNIPYHITADPDGKLFDRSLAEQFDAPNRMIIEDGEEIIIE